MSQQGSNTTFRVGGTARQAGGNWTGRFENPNGLNAWHSMYGSRLEPGDTVTVGDAILKWTGSAYKVIDGDFVDGPAANAWAANFRPELASGSTATVAGQQVKWGGAGAGWVAVDAPVIPFSSVVIGDSITASNPSAPVLGVWGAGLVMTKNAGVAEERSDQMLARFDVDVIAYRPRFVLIQAGTNDIQQSRSMDSAIADILAMHSKAIAAGASVFISIPPPCDGAELANQSAFNEKLAYALSGRGCDYGNPWEAYTNPLTGGWVSGATSDGIHPTPETASGAGTALKEMILGSTHISKIQAPLMNQAGNGFVPNPLMLLDTNADGTPNDWLGGNGALTASINVSSGFFGKAWKLSASSTDITSGALKYTALSTPGVGGHVIMCAFKAKYTTDKTAKFTLYVEDKVAGVGKGRKYVVQDCVTAIDGYCRSAFVAAPGTTSIAITLAVSRVSGTSSTVSVEIGELQLYDITALGLA